VFDDQLLAFVGVAIVLTLTPGPDMALVLRNTLRGGRAAGFRTIGGTAVGLLGWASASALGVAAVLAASATVFTALKLAGAVYLVYLGVQSLLALRRGRVPHDEQPPSGSPFRQGLVTNLLNPKLAVLFTTLLPQFIDTDDPAVAKSALLAAIFVAIGLTWLVTYTLIIESVARSRTFRRITEAVSGVVLVALGVRLAVER
jgi:threonine/homoserine/homoserine lactone efflux protein